VSGTAEEKVRLRAVATRAEGFAEADPLEEPLGEAKGAVPLLWLGLFEYDDVEVRQHHGADVFSAVTPADKAAARLRKLRDLLPTSPEALRVSTQILGKAVERANRPLVALYPVELFGQMRPTDGRDYLRHLVNLCELWERTRGGDLTWQETLSQLEHIKAYIDQALGGDDQQMICYTLVGSLAERYGEAQAFRGVDETLYVSLGQGPDDLEPEAVAVGEQGLALGRFGGVWKLMSSSCSKDLHAVCGAEHTAWAVGRGGTVVQMKGGIWSKLEVPTTESLNTAWAMNPDTVCVAGEGGTVLVLSGSEWRPWAVPSRGSIHRIWGTGPDNICLATEEPAVFRYDGYSWQRMPLPDQGTVSAFGVMGGKVVATGGSRRGGELFVLDRAGWNNETRLPRVDWIEGLWRGWGDEVGVVQQTGEALVNADGEWTRERLPVDSVTAVAGGTMPMATGRLGQQTVIVVRTEAGWKVETALAGLKLGAIWVAGRPKPPRFEAKPASGGDG